MRAMGNTADLLTDREIEVARLTADGKSAPEIGKALNISPGTVKKHLQSVYRTLGISGASPAKQLMKNPKLLQTKGKSGDSARNIGV